MKNYEKIVKKISDLGYTVGCYDKQINKLNYNNLKKIIDNIEYQNDTRICINRKKYIAQIDIVDGEVDINIIDLKSYTDMFGEWED